MRRPFFALILAFVFFVSFQSVNAQEPPSLSEGSVFDMQARAAASRILTSEGRAVYLWGIEDLGGVGAGFKLKARTVLDNLVGNRPVQCEVKKLRSDGVLAQCVNADQQDLSLMLLQKGYATADRSAVYDTVFEKPYIESEAQAQKSGLGIWADSTGNVLSGLEIWIFVLLFVCAAGFSALVFVALHGFQKILFLQSKQIDLIDKEHKIREKERDVLVAILDSELKANKSKIEAYLVVYEEVLRELKNTDKPPRYQRSGDIVQQQPALQRSVFDRNTDKLEMLDRDLASDLVHFYARIKTHPDYINLEPDMEASEAMFIVEEALENARELGVLTEEIMDDLENENAKLK